MSKLTVDEAMEKILKIERESIKKRQDVVSANTMKFGKNKADADVVHAILNILEEEGVGNED